MKNKRGFTLVELLAVIVILAIILVVAVPQILKTINASRLSSFKSSAELLITEGIKQYMIDQTESANTGDDLSAVKYGGIGTKSSGADRACTFLTELSINDYATCEMTVSNEGVATLTEFTGKGKFKGYSCTGTKNNVVCNGDGNIGSGIVTPVKEGSTLMAWAMDANTDFHNSSIRTTITEIEFVDLNEVNAPAINNSTSWDVSEEQNESVIAWLDGTKLYIGGIDGVKGNTDSSNLFRNFTHATSIEFNNNFNTSDVENMYNMFYGCKVVESLDLSSFDTSKVTNMAGMFDYGESTSSSEKMKLKRINLSGKFNTLLVTKTQWMFSKCQDLKTIIVNENVNFDNVTESEGMFHNCTSLVGGNGTKFNSSYRDKTYAKIDREDQTGYFTKDINYGTNFMPNMIGMSLYTDYNEYNSGDTWNNKIGDNNIEIQGTAIKNSDGSITLTGSTDSNYASVEVGQSAERTIYVIAKENALSSDYWSPIFTSAITHDAKYYALDVFSRNNVIASSSVHGDVHSNKNALQYNAIAIVSNTNNSKYKFYINGEYIGESTAYKNYRNNMMYLNAVYRNGLIIGNNSISYKFLAVSKINQDEEDIIENLNWLMNKYNIEG